MMRRHGGRHRVPPIFSRDRATRARSRQPVFVEKPLAPISQARRHARIRAGKRRPTILDSIFPSCSRGGLPRRCWMWSDHAPCGRQLERREPGNAPAARELEDARRRRRGLIGNLRLPLHALSEWFCGPIAGLNARIFPLPGRRRGEQHALALAFASGAAGSLQYECASFLGSGHRSILWRMRHTRSGQSHPDYSVAVTLMRAQRADNVLQVCRGRGYRLDQSPDFTRRSGGRLVRRFIDACESGGDPAPGFTRAIVCSA